MTDSPAQAAPATSATTSSSATLRGRRKPKPAGVNPLVWVGVGVGGAVALGGLLALMLVLGGGGASMANVVIELGPAERGEAAVVIDGKKQSLPASGPVRYELAPGSHRVVVQRRGFDPVEESLTLAAGQQRTIQPDWRPSAPPTLDSFAGRGPSPTTPTTTNRPGGIGDFSSPSPGVTETIAPAGFQGWEQSIVLAERQAQAENKDLLLVFVGSDWCPPCRELSRRVLGEREFFEYVGERFVRVVLDFPRTADGMNRVADTAQNEEQAKRHQVRSFPTIVLADSRGRPYARVEGYSGAAARQFVGELQQQEAKKAERDRLLAATNSGEPAQRVAGAAAAAKFLLESGVAWFYLEELRAWERQAQQVDASNAAGHYETVFGVAWLARIVERMRTDASSIRPIVEELRRWSEGHSFRDHDFAVRLHLVGAAVVNDVDTELTERLLEMAVAFQPNDPALKQQLASLGNVLGGIISSGTGFVIQPGWILTNHHVIDGEGKVKIRLPSGNALIDGEVVASDKRLDMAIVRVTDPRLAQLPPLTVSRREVGRGDAVAAFGFPLATAVGVGLKLTTGVVSGLPTPENEGMYLLDCRVNPGNSGGPLCNNRGEVVGMVTAKSISNETTDSYGLARPAEELIPFLTQHVPGYQPPTSDDGGAAEQTWGAVDRQVSASVLLIFKTRK